MDRGTDSQKTNEFDRLMERKTVGRVDRQINEFMDCFIGR
jgi:hypothetical protein